MHLAMARIATYSGFCVPEICLPVIGKKRIELAEHAALGGAGALAVAQQLAARFCPGKFIGGEPQAAQVLQMLLQGVVEEEGAGGFARPWRAGR